MLEKFCEYLEQIGISRADLYLQESDEVTMVTFRQEGIAGARFYVSLAFYRDSDKVEISVLLNSERSGESEVLQKVNALNIGYCGITFFALSNALAVKIYMEDNYALDDLLAKVMLAITVAEKELPNI